MTESRPRVAVVAATHNRAARLAMLIESLRRQTLPAREFEVVIVDDASADDTRRVLEAEIAKGDLALRAIHRETGAGPGVARNQGWRAAAAPVIAFTDDDCVADPDWLAAGLRALDGSDEVIVQGMTEPLPAEAHLMGPFSRTLVIRELSPYFQTCNIFYPRAMLESLGGFDGETYTGPAGEDADLAWRAIDAGARPRFAREARVFHAVVRLGPLRYLRHAGRWTESVQLFRRHPQLRRTHLHHRIFWDGSHYLLVRALLALLLRRRLPLPLVNWLASPYLITQVARARAVGGGAITTPYWILFDLLELAAMLRASARYRTLVI